MKRRPVQPLNRRRAAVEYVKGRFKGKPCDFARFDCIRMFRTLLVKMGHRGLPKLPPYKTQAGALRALSAHGWSNVVDMVDAVLPGRRIPPAELWLGDIVVVQDELGIGCVMIHQGGGAFLGWVEGAEVATTTFVKVVEAAWRT